MSLSGIFLSLFLGPNISPFPIRKKNKTKKLPIMVYIIPNFWKTCFHSHFYAHFQEFYEGQSKQQICYSFILLVSIYLKCRHNINFSQLWWSKCFFSNSTGPWSRFQKSRKIPNYQKNTYCPFTHQFYSSIWSSNYDRHSLPVTEMEKNISGFIQASMSKFKDF